MKTLQQKPATSKLLIRYDNELKNLLLADLKAFRERGQFARNNQSAAKAA
ncbi:hypothetical protein [Mucilaginibacter sp. UYCu711]